MKLRALRQNENAQDEIFQSPECQELLKVYETYYPEMGYQPPWTAYLILHHNKVVGTCSFTGKPVDGKVEIAYWTFKEFEGQGIASFACKELIEIALKADSSVRITAKTAPEKNASTAILEKNGFVYSEIVQDEDIGDAWLWTMQ